MHIDDIEPGMVFNMDIGDYGIMGYYGDGDGEDLQVSKANSCVVVSVDIDTECLLCEFRDGCGFDCGSMGNCAYFIFAGKLIERGLCRELGIDEPDE